MHEIRWVFPEAAESAGATTALALETLLGMARLRHGDAAVLGASTRREGDAVEALWVM